MPKRTFARLAILLVALLALPVPSHAQFGPVAATNATPHAGIRERIVAVVNDNVISSTDLGARLAMAFLSSGLPDTPEVRQRLLVQILRSMVDEQLELQEAKKLDISVSDSDIDKALDKIAHRNFFIADIVQHHRLHRADILDAEIGKLDPHHVEKAAMHALDQARQFLHDLRGGRAGGILQSVCLAGGRKTWVHGEYCQ